MKFRAIVEDEDCVWWEDYDIDTETPLEWARHIVAVFNSSRNEYEKERHVLWIKVLDSGKTFADHKWEKSNLVTIVERGGGNYDTARCKVCGITGRRYGLSGTVAIDKKFKAKVYSRCDTAKAHLEKRRQRND